MTHYSKGAFAPIVDDPLHSKGAFAPAGRIPVRALTPAHEGLGYAAQLVVPAFQPRVSRSGGDANFAADNPALLEKRRHLKTSIWHIPGRGRGWNSNRVCSPAHGRCIPATSLPPSGRCKSCRRQSSHSATTTFKDLGLAHRQHFSAIAGLFLNN
jgi:hypothetical protein